MGDLWDKVQAARGNDNNYQGTSESGRIINTLNEIAENQRTLIRVQERMCNILGDIQTDVWIRT